MSIAIYEDVQTGRQHWADSTSPTTADHLVEGDWVLVDDTPATPPPPGDPLDLAMTAIQANQSSAFSVEQRAALVTVVGSVAAPITNAATARPTGAAGVFWYCAAGVTPTNAVNGDLIWNA